MSCVLRISVASREGVLNALTSGLPGGRPRELLGICTFLTSSLVSRLCVCVCVGGGGGGEGVETATVGSESSDEASSHNVQFFRGLFHFQW